MNRALRAWRQLRVVDVVAGLYAVAYFAWMALRTPGTPQSELVASVAFYPLGPAVAWACWRTSRVPGLDLRTRTAWRLLLIAYLALSISGTTWDIYTHTLAAGGYPHWVDNLETTMHLLAVLGYLTFPSLPLGGRRRARVLLDGSLVVVACSVVAVYFGWRLWQLHPDPKEVVSSVISTGIDWIVLVVAAIGALRKRDAQTRESLGVLVLASTVYVIGNYYFTLQGESAYRSGGVIDGVWFLAWVFRWVAARRSWYRWTGAAVSHVDAPARAASGSEGGGFAYAMVAGCFVLLTSQVFTDAPEYTLLAFSAIVTTALMLTRQFVELRENRRLLDEQLAQEARFRLLVERSSDAVLIVDAAGVVSFASPTVVRVFGEPSHVCAGVRLVDVVRDDDRPLLSQVLGGGGGPRRFHVHVRAGEGEWREIEAVWTDLRPDRAVDGVVINCRDVTERSDLERQLRHAQKLDAVGQLAGGLAHDVNNALAIVGGYTELLKGELDGSPAGDDLAHIQHAVDRAASITRKVLAFSRKQVAQPVVLDLNEIVRDMLPMVRQLMSADVEVRSRLGPALWAVKMDRGQVEQVLVNLAANARDAMPDGGVLEIATDNRVVTSVAARSGALPPGDFVTLTIRDQGVGMTEQVREHIFEPFFTTKTATGGMGLGLAMVHGIIKAAGGRVVVDSAPGEGSTFTILLPRAEAAVVAGVQETGTSEQPLRGCTVLVVDDEENVRVVARRMLERQGYEVIDAGNGAEALDVIGNPAVKIDLLLTDLVMPGLHGRQLIARCETIRPALPIVCMTGFAGEGDDPHQYGRNLVALLSKPFSSEALKRAVAAAIAGRSLS